MKKVFWVVCIVSGLAGMIFGTAFAGETGHYVNGVEGIKAATVPPPGFYWRLYNLYYTADTLTNQDGKETNVGFDVRVFAMANRFLWISDVKILGANYGADAIIPLIYTDIEISAAGISDDKFGLGDILLEPFVLSWHGAQYDASFATGVYVPTGTYDKTEPASPGKDFWTGMMTLGGTYYFDAEKTWSASLLSRYEIHSEKGDEDITPGNDFHFEWGLGKTIGGIWDVGVSGYCQWQVTDDSGDDVTSDTNVRDEVFAMGPEISAFIPNAKLFISFRNLWEFDAVDRSEGVVTALTLTKIF